MNQLDKVIGVFSPERAVNRMRARRVMAAYEAAKPTRTRKNKSDNRSGDSVAEFSVDELRGQARHLEQNHDFAFGILTTLVNNIVGPRGIGVEFQPKRHDGTIHKEFAKVLTSGYVKWSKRPETTRQMSWGKSQRLMCLTWLRDGEGLLRHLEGSIPGLNHRAGVDYSIELLEPDFLPSSLNDASKRITQGIERSLWGEVIKYHLYDEHPGGNLSWKMQTRGHSASSIEHIRMVRRLHQLRGVSIFAAVMNRINDIKDYEESERVAARIAAAMVGYIKKGTPDLYTSPGEEDDEGNRLFGVEPGMIYDDLREGEDVGIIESNRPTSLLTPFLDTMHRMTAAGTMSSASSISKNYQGAYSAQRQELVDQWANYETLSCEFVDEIVEPVVSRYVRMAVLSNAIDVPIDVDRDTLLDIDFIPPTMPWIDPQKEANSDETLLENRLTSPQKVIRRRGSNPRDVLDQLEVWDKELEERGLKQGEPGRPPKPNKTTTEEPAE